MDTWSVEETVQRSTAVKANEGATFDEFVAGVRLLLEGQAASKGYSPNGADGHNPLFEFVAEVVGGQQHAIGEGIYKLVRYQRKRNREDLLKAAAWCFLMYRYHQ